MKIIFQRFSKKAMLESPIVQLFYIMLGVIVLITFVKVIFTFLNLDAHTNSDYADQTANSINDYLTFSSDEYSNSNYCYTTLKLTHLENYQFKEIGNNGLENYFFIISSDGIYKHKISKEDDFYKKESLSSAKKILTFKKPVSFLFDNTVGSEMNSNDITTFFTSFNPDTKLDLKDKSDGNDIKYIVLNPVFDVLSFSVGNSVSNTFFALFDTNIDYFEGSNRFKMRLINSDWDEEDMFGDRLHFIPKTKQLLPSATAFTEQLIYKDLCSFKELENSVRDRNYKKNLGRNIDYINNRIYLGVLVDGVKSPTTFEWSNGPICKENNLKLDCNKLFNLDSSFKLTYLKFIDKAEVYIIDKYSSGIDLSWDVKSEKLSIKEIRSKSEDLDISVLFNSPTGSGVNIPQMEIDKTLSKNNIFSLENSFGWNKEINNCDEDLCNYIYLYNGKLVYYYSGFEQNNLKYKYFNENYLRKIRNKESEFEYDFYLNGEKLDNLEKLSADKLGAWTTDDKNIYIFKEVIGYVNYKSIFFTIILTSKQLSNIPEGNLK
jgi:hypothetical protein